MTDDARFLVYVSLSVAWLLCIGFAGDVGARKNCRFSGIILGFFFGPFGIIAAGFLDARPLCPNCGGRLNQSRVVQLFPLCHQCRHEFYRMNKAAFTFEGLSLSATIDDLLERHPAAVLNRKQSDDTIGLKCFTVARGTTADAVGWSFLDGALYSIQIVYGVEQANESGGVAAIAEQLSAAFGTPQRAEDSQGRLKLSWANDYHTANLTSTRSGLTVVVKDVAAESIVNRRIEQRDGHGFGPDETSATSEASAAIVFLARE